MNITMQIDPEETLLLGSWQSSNGITTADDTTRRIERLTQDYLVELGHDSSGWITLYSDPQDGRLWELDYPSSELHGGGPPRLRNVSQAYVRQRYTNEEIRLSDLPDTSSPKD